MSEKTQEFMLPALVFGPWVLIGWYRLIELLTAVFF